MNQVQMMIKTFIMWAQDLYTKPKNPLPHERFSFNISVELPSEREVEIKLLKANLWLCFLFISAVIILHPEYYQVMNSVKGFSAFVICIMLSFTGVFSALLLRNKPKLAVLRSCYFFLSIFSMASALSILGYALFQVALSRNK